MSKITKKIGHDTIWVKATLANKDFIKLTIGRSGPRVVGSASPEAAKPFMEIFSRVYKEWRAIPDAVYGSLVEMVADAWAKV